MTLHLSADGMSGIDVNIASVCSAAQCRNYQDIYGRKHHQLQRVAQLRQYLIATTIRGGTGLL